MCAPIQCKAFYLESNLETKRSLGQGEYLLKSPVAIVDMSKVFMCFQTLL